MSLALLQPTLSPTPRLRRSVPLLPVAVGLMLGIAADRTFPIPAWACGLLALIGAVAVVVRPRSTLLGTAGLIIAAAGLGALRHGLADRRLPTDHLALHMATEPMLAELVGRVISSPRIVEPAKDIPRPYEVGPRTRFMFQAESLLADVGVISVSGRVAATVQDAVPGLHEGDVIRMTGWLYRPRGPSNPGEYDWAAHLRREQVFVGFSCAHAESVRFVQRGGGGIGVSGRRVRDRLRGYLLDSAFEESDEGAGVMSAMVLGERGAVSRSMNEAFRRTGTSHYLAASGMQVAWLALIGWGIATVAGLHYRTTAVVVAGLIASYALIAEPEPSILRAAIIGLLACAAAISRGHYSSLNSLACAAIMLLMLRPMDLFSPGFQLSFLATIGLLQFCPRFAEAVSRLLIRLRCERAASYVSMTPYALGLFQFRDEQGSTIRVIGRFLLRAVVQLFVLSVAEWIITAPLLCYQFNTLAPWAWFASFVLYFLTLPATCVGYLAVLVGVVFPSSTVVWGPLLQALADATVRCVDFLSKIPLTLVYGRSPSLAWVIYCYVLIAGGLLGWGFFAGRRRPVPALLVMIAVLWWWAAPVATRLGAPTLRIWMLAVGDGTGTVIELPNGKAMVCDFGTRSGLDAGRVAIDFLRHRGIRKLDTVLVSHADFDHYGAIPQIAREVPIRRIILNDHFARFSSGNRAVAEFETAVRAAGTPIEVRQGPGVLFEEDGVRVESIWPPAAAEQVIASDNDSSTVLRVSFQGRTILLPGDLADAGLAGLLARGDMRADALALPHHGGVGANTARFIEAVNPRFAIRSTGQRRALTTNGIQSLVGPREYFSTADDGAVLVEIRQGMVSARPVMRSTEPRTAPTYAATASMRPKSGASQAEAESAGEP